MYGERDAASTPPAPRIAQGASAGHAWRSGHGRATARPCARVVSLEDVELAATVITDDDRNHGRYPQPALETVEVRVMDGQSRVGDVPPVVALIQSLVRLELECEPSPVVPGAELPAETRFLAARDRMDARLIDSEAPCLIPVRESLDSFGRLPPARARAQLHPRARRGAAASSRKRRRVSVQIRRAHPPPQ